MARGLAVVAGATGYLGGHVVEALHAAGFRVRALARDPARLARVRASCDEVFVGEATRPETLRGLFDGAALAFSSVGIRHVKRHPTYLEVDRDANLGLVEAARAAGVARFVFVSVLHGDELRGELALADARETVVEALARSGMRALVLRPTGFFNDMAEFFEMARKGRVYLLGDGSPRINPIHAGDIADEVVRRLDAGEDEGAAPLGGPDVLTLREVGQLAFDVLRKPARFASIPPWVVRAASAAAKPFNKNAAALGIAFASMATHDAVAPCVGHRHLRDFYAELARGARSAARA
ncbi:MAG TPA: SDR family oxidoreductase [Minicystis sp.]|nr:SDR family oxidoreductase [Minicystis sp.]